MIIMHLDECAAAATEVVRAVCLGAHDRWVRVSVPPPQGRDIRLGGHRRMGIANAKGAVGLDGGEDQERSRGYRFFLYLSPSLTPLGGPSPPGPQHPPTQLD